MELVSLERFHSVADQAAAAGVPIMIVHQSDGLGCDMQKTHTQQSVGPGTSVTRVGRYRAELLLDLVIAKTFNHTGQFVQALHFYAPRNMAGKTGWHIFTGSLECLCTFHCVPKTDVIKVDVLVQDGLHAAGMKAKQVAYRHLLYDHFSCEGEEPSACSHMHWTFGWRCILHIAQSASKWGLAPVLSESIQHDAHCMIASLNNSSDPILRRLDELIYIRVLHDECRHLRRNVQGYQESSWQRQGAGPLHGHRV